jgi:signal transduction histidine kinase/streptogramin lyase
VVDLSYSGSIYYFSAIRLFRTLLKLKFLIVTGIILSSFTYSFGQSKILQFKHITVEDGLSNSQAVSILQDYKGFMWIGTYDGLNRFDGATMVVYKNIPSQPTSLPENHVRTLFEDRNKNLFVGTWDGLSMYNRDLDQFVNYRFEQTSALYGLDISVFKITEDAIGNLWLGTNNGLVYFDRKNNKKTVYQNEPNNRQSISNNTMDCVYIDKRDRLWVATRKGLNLFIPETGNFKRITRCKTDQENLTDVFFLDITEDLEGNIWFGSTDGLFCLENKQTNEEIELIHYKSTPSQPKSLSNNRTRSLFVDDDGNLWIGTENGGINLFNKEDQNFTHFGIDESNPMGLNHESIHAITQDRSKNLWFCTYGGGVNISIRNGDFILHYKNFPGASQSLSYNIVSCFLEDSDGKIWVGTDGGGFNLLNEKTRQFSRFTSSNTSLTSNAILCMAEGNDQYIWMGTWEGGLIRFSRSDHTIKTFTTRNSGIPDNSIYSIATDLKGNLWLGSFRHGLIKFNLETNTFQSFSPKNINIENSEISVVRANSKGQLFMGTNNGFQIFAFIPEENRFVTYDMVQDSSSKRNNSVFDILIENDTCAWVATQRGLYWFNPVSGDYKWYSITDGLPDNTIKALTLDKTGLLWISTNSGICRFDCRNKIFTNFSTSDGLQSNEFFKGSILTTKSGVILAGGTNGFNLIDPEKKTDNKNIPVVNITDFHIFREKVNVGTKGSPLVKQISETAEITLNYKQTVLTFRFAVMDFTNPRKNQYAYLMENFDKDWVYSGNSSDATYTNLNPGKYIFRVKGANNDGTWNETGAKLDITITPPWWKTNIAIVSFILFFILSFFGFYFFRVNQLKAQKAKLEKLIKIRTHEIEEKNHMLINQTSELNSRQQQIEEQDEQLRLANNQLTLLNATKDKFFSIIAHDLKNPFNNILGFTQMLKDEDHPAMDERCKRITNQLYISANSTYKLLENLLEWSKSQSNKISFEPQPTSLHTLFQEISDIQRSNSKNVDIQYVLKENISVYVDVNMVKTILRNLISNAVKFSHENGLVTLDAVKNHNTATITITDNGIGIAKENLVKLFDLTQKFSLAGTAQEKGTGLGLIICKEFVEKHGGQIWAESNPDSHDGGNGSTFKFTLPLAPQTDIK